MNAQVTFWKAFADQVQRYNQLENLKLRAANDNLFKIARKYCVENARLRREKKGVK